MQLTIALALTPVLAQPDQLVGQRPYELDWAGRTHDDHPPLVDFEDLEGWTVECQYSEARLERTREQQIWDRYVAKLTYRGLKGGGPVVRVRPPEPVPVNEPFDAVTLWVYGNNWGYAPDPNTPQVGISVLFADSAGSEFEVYLYHVDWTDWYLLHRRLSPDQIERVRDGATLRGIVIRGGTNPRDRVLYFDNLAVFTEQFPALTFEPRPERGIPMFPGQSTGTNTGPGKLPFPTRPETILPQNVTEDYTNTVRREGGAFVLLYEGADGRLTYSIEPRTGTLGDITATWAGRGGAVRPCVGGGPRLVVGSEVVTPERAVHLGTAIQGDTVVSQWRLSAGDVSAEVTYSYRIWAKSLVVDVVCPGGAVAEVHYGLAQGLEGPRLVQNPYYVYNGWRSDRPSVAVSGPPEEPLFLAGNTDWCLSNASVPFGGNQVTEDGVLYNGGTRYIPRTDGIRNDCFERLFITLTPRYEECLPVIPNPVSPWKHVTGTRVWRAHGAGDRAADARHWRQVHRYGMTEVVVTDHETGWRDGGESFTFRTRTAPGKGGDQGQYDYARLMQDELGFVYGPYNNYTDFAPVNEFWSFDLISRTPDLQLQHAWMRCYAPKPARAVEYCARLAPIIQDKFRFSTAYCDVHTAVAPWDRVDYDARVPGAGTFGAVFYAYGEIMLHQKAAWQGPVYSEGGHHYLYCGLTDGNYGQDSSARLGVRPWLVDFDLRRMHDLCCNFGMGDPSMFWGGDMGVRSPGAEQDAAVDRFLAATVAFGHPGFLHLNGGMHNALRSYYMLQQLHSRYCLASASDIRYLDSDGRFLDTSAAVATGAWERSQIVTRYTDGTVTVVNGHLSEPLRVNVDGRDLDLPPSGYAGWTAEGDLWVLSGHRDGQRADYAVTPAYIYVDGRGRFARFDRAASAGIGICRKLADGRYEVIPYQGVECGFAVSASSARALDEARNDLGPAELRTARGLTYVVPVSGAFSYLLEPSPAPPTALLSCERDTVVAGETVTVNGAERHQVAIRSDAKPGDRIWVALEGQWIDFTVVPLADVRVSLEGNTLRLALKSNLGEPADGSITVDGRSQLIALQPGQVSHAEVDLGAPAHEEARILAITVEARGVQQRIELGMRVEYGHRSIATLPDRFEGGMRVRGQGEQVGFGDTSANAYRTDYACGGVTKPSIAMHPPWVGAVGYTYALFDAVSLPPGEAAAFRASVGKGDGSDPGDGILYRVAVVDGQGIETIAGTQTVADHRWLPIEADLSRWVGQTVRIKLIADPGPADDTVGDWACWADFRIETLESELTRSLDEQADAYRREPAPFPAGGVTVADLRQATSGWLHYDGLGLTGGADTYGSSAILNGVVVGPMAPAGGDEATGIWAKDVTVPLTSEAIATLGLLNTLEIDNHGGDFFSVGRFWIELQLADGRRVSSEISAATYTQPPTWPYAQGILVPFGHRITVDIWFKP